MMLTAKGRKDSSKNDEGSASFLRLQPQATPTAQLKHSFYADKANSDEES